MNAWASLFWFAAIVAMIPAALWLLRRSPVGGTLAGPGLMRQVSALALAPNQRVVTVEVGSGEARRWLVLGVTPHGISTLHTMTPQAELPPAGTPAPPFGQMLARLRGENDRAA